MDSTLEVTLSPRPGFCIKSAALEPGVYNGKIPVPAGLKTFVNVAYDDDAPPPAPGALDAAQAAMQSQGPPPADDDAAPFLPVLVSEGRSVTDKAGKASIVFDAVFHTSVKSPVLKDQAFKLYIIELALQHIETQSGLSLSRTLGAPNIASKGPIPPLKLKLSPQLYPPEHKLRTKPKSAKPLVEEVKPKKGILKTSNSTPKPVESGETPAWTWSQTGDRLRIEIKVPKLTRDCIPSAALDVEGRRLLLNIPGLYNLDVDLTLPDNKLQSQLALAGAGPNGVETALMLKRARALDVDGAEAEWKVDEGKLVLIC